MKRTGRVAVVVVGALAAAASILMFWLNPPKWGLCVDGEDFGYCTEGVFWSNAIVGTSLVLVGVVVLAVITLAAPPKGIGLAMGVACGVYAVLLVAAWVFQVVTLEAVPMR